MLSTFCIIPYIVTKDKRSLQNVYFFTAVFRVIGRFTRTSSYIFCRVVVQFVEHMKLTLLAMAKGHSGSLKIH